jgi:hypothetical protein
LDAGIIKQADLFYLFQSLNFPSADAANCVGADLQGFWDYKGGTVPQMRSNFYQYYPLAFDS